jgi:hypothetical protein
VQVYTNSPPPLLVLVGIGFIAGACALAWFSSLDTVTVTRTGPASADVAFDDALLGLVTIEGERISGVRAARVGVPSFEGRGSHSASTRFLIFDTAKGEVYADADRHYFHRYADDITAFIADPGRNELILRTSDDGRELFRFLFAQACVILLGVVGWFVTRLGVRMLLAGSSAGAGRA